jgi:hypothetical protein
METKKKVGRLKKVKETPKLITYKGFNKDWTCRDFQYKVGETYTTDKAVRCTEFGFHSCENPLDILNYYDATTSIFAICECSGEIDKGSDDSKISSSIIKIVTEVDFNTLIRIAKEYIEKKAEINNNTNHDSGDNSVASNSGYNSVASNSGDNSVASNSGNNSVASNSGDNSVASNSGNNSVASDSGYNSVASNSGNKSVASNSGNNSVASDSGYNSVASNSGDNSVASNSGYKSVASNSGNKSVASNSGNNSVASNSGNNSVASDSGYNSVASNSGYNSVASNSGNNSVASNSGNNSVASNSGNNGISLGWGFSNRAKGILGSWICLSEQNENYEIIDAKLAKVDGIEIKENTEYILINGKFEEYKDED